MNKPAERIKNVSPGALVAAAFIGPGTVTSCSISGATAGYTLLWAMLLSVISVIIMQSMAARLGIVSGMGLGEALRTKLTGNTPRILISILLIVSNDAGIMGEYKNKTWFNILVIIVIAIFIFIAARNMRAFVSGLQALLSA